MNEEHLAKFAKSTETESRRKRFSCPNGANRRASGAKTATTTANGANRLASACSVAGAKSATPTACVTSAEMALGLRQTSHSAGHWRFLPPFFFVAVGAKFFFNAPLTNLDDLMAMLVKIRSEAEDREARYLNQIRSLKEKVNTLESSLASMQIGAQKNEERLTQGT